MRLKITVNTTKLCLPINYQSILQGLIYNIFDTKEYGKFLHDEGYRIGKKVFKLFTFSNLYGKYEVLKHTITYTGKVYFYISSYSEEFMKIIYEFMCKNNCFSLHHQIVHIENLEFLDVKYFKGEKDVLIRTISPLVAYRTDGKYVTYFSPSSCEFNSCCLINLREKNMSLGNPIEEIVFNIEEIINEKKRMVTFKNTFYETYIAEMKIHVNYETLLLIYNTGLSSKGSAGFGMIEIVQ